MSNGAQLRDKKDYTSVGKAFPVKDAIQKVTGALKYAVDKEVQGMAHAKILRSPYAHADIVSIDTSKAEALDGVYGVLTHKDVPQQYWNGCWFNYVGISLDDRVRFHGDDVAVVAAISEEIAERALELIDVEYKELPAVFDIEGARKDDAPQVRREGNKRPPYTFAWGDLKEGLAESVHVAEVDIPFQAQHFASIGRNACIAEWNGDNVTVWTATQTPSELRDGLAEALDVPVSNVRVMGQPSGSSMGLWWSNNFMMLSALMARKIQRPVKIELDNEECFNAVKRRHVEHTWGRMGCDADGKITLFEVDHGIDNGAYGWKDDVGAFCVDTWGSRAKNGDFTVRPVSTNLLTAGCMRGVGDVTLGSAVERMADILAEKVGMDPMEFRLLNEIGDGEQLRFIHSRHTINGDIKEYISNIPEELKEDWPEPFKLSSGGPAPLLKLGSETFGWKERWKGWGTPSKVNGSVMTGVGVGTGAHTCGVEFEGGVAAVVRVNHDGSAKVHAAAGRQGAGSETTQAQIVAEILGIPFDRVSSEVGDTDSCPWAHGSLASNTMYRTGWATKEAATDARDQILDIASREFFEGCDPSELDILDSQVFHKAQGPGGKQVSLADIMMHLRQDSLGQTSSITGRVRNPMPPATTFARQFAAHYAEVEVDVDTGEVRLTDYVCAQDSGTVMNPAVLKNQIAGAAICGSGFALFEEMIFDEKTGALRNPGLLDYKVLRISDFPHQTEVVFEEPCDPVGPFGAKGAGESPIAASTAAVSQAVYNAIGVWVDMPMTPERVLRALGRVS